MAGLPVPHWWWWWCYCREKEGPAVKEGSSLLSAGAALCGNVAAAVLFKQLPHAPPLQ